MLESHLQEEAVTMCVTRVLESLQKLEHRPAKQTSLIAYLRRILLPRPCKAYVLDPREVAEALINNGAIPVVQDARYDPEEEQVLSNFESVYLNSEAVCALGKTTPRRRYTMLVEVMNKLDMAVAEDKKKYKADRKELSDFVVSRLIVCPENDFGEVVQSLKDALFSAAPVEAHKRSLHDHSIDMGRILLYARKKGFVLTRRALHHVAHWVVSQSYVLLHVSLQEVLLKLQDCGHICVDEKGFLQYDLPNPLVVPTDVGDNVDLAVGSDSAPDNEMSFWHPRGARIKSPAQDLSHSNTAKTRHIFETPGLAWTPHLRNPAKRVERFVLPWSKRGQFIGPGGDTIRKFKAKTRLDSVSLTGDQDSQYDRTATSYCELVGSVIAVYRAVENLKSFSTKGYLPILYPDFVDDKFVVPRRCASKIIGIRGSVIRTLKTHFNVVIELPPGDNLRKQDVNIAGSRLAVLHCGNVIRSILKCGHHELTHPGCSHKFLNIDPKDYAHLIGHKGCESRHIQNNWHVCLNIPGPNARYLSDSVLVFGDPNQVKRAVEYIARMLVRKNGKQLEDEGCREDSRADPVEHIHDQIRKAHEIESIKGREQRAHQKHEHHYKGEKNEHHRKNGHHGHSHQVSSKEHELHLHEVDKRRRDLARNRCRDAKYED